MKTLPRLAVVFTISLAAFCSADEKNRDFTPGVKAILKKYCFECHSKDVTEADIDLEKFRKESDLRKDTKLWVRVREMLRTRQMPPKEASQPTGEEAQRLVRWVEAFLKHEASRFAGDAGPVILRRLTNAEYNYSVRDLTGIDSLDPTREFPVDGAAGEGFTNSGNAQGMSPALVQKYLDAGKRVAAHAVLTPTGLRFSSKTTRRDHTVEIVEQVEAFYRKYTAQGGGVTLTFAGKPFVANQGGRLPLEKYLAATIKHRAALQAGSLKIADIARQDGLSSKYLGLLWQTLHDPKGSSSPWLHELRRKWRTAQLDDVKELSGWIVKWQNVLFKFNAIGHIGRDGGPKAWMEDVTPLVNRHDLNLELSPRSGDTTVHLSTAETGINGGKHWVIWQNPRLEFPGTSRLAPLPLKELGFVSAAVREKMRRELPRTAQYLAAVASMKDVDQSTEKLAEKLKLDKELLENWSQLLAMGYRVKRQVAGHFGNRISNVHNKKAIRGWDMGKLPSLLTNNSNRPIKFLNITVPPRAVTVHPSPQLNAVVVWQAPVDGTFSLKGLIADADPACGNGAGWRCEAVSRLGLQVIGKSEFASGGSQTLKPSQPLRLREGDLVRLVVHPKGTNHGCDTTHIEFTLQEVDGKKRTWDLASDIVDDVHKNNPLHDSYGNPGVWHFCREPKAGGKPELKITAGSTLAQWRAAVIEGKSAEKQLELANQVASLLDNDKNLSPADSKLRDVLLEWHGPLRWLQSVRQTNSKTKLKYGVVSKLPATLPASVKPAKLDIAVPAPFQLTVRVPHELTRGVRLVASGISVPLDAKSKGFVQLSATVGEPKPLAMDPTAPILVSDHAGHREQVRSSMSEFRALFPAALCYENIVPLDEVVTLRLYYREDEPFRRLMLSAAEAKELDRLWDELLFVSREPIKLTVSFEQIYEFATQDRPDLVKAFASLRKPINDRAENFRKRLVATEPMHVEQVLAFADRAWRRPLSTTEKGELRSLYRLLRQREIGHEEAVRLVIARILTTPMFLYKMENAAAEKQSPVTDHEIATRLSYFLWASPPDRQLRELAKAGKLQSPEALVQQTKRMLQDNRIRRMAIEFGCQWLHLRDFDDNDEKNEKLYPDFAQLRKSMYEETIQFFKHLIQEDRSILDIISADYVLVNDQLAKHYGIPKVTGDSWRPVQMGANSDRGGVLGMASVLASQSGASRTSPILRGNYVFETILGDRLPRPPANVPQLPETVPSGLTARQLIEKHSSDPACAKCHRRIDPFGFALEQYDAIGRRRPKRANTSTTLADGTKLNGFRGLKDYLVKARRADFVRQFNRKLLGYALGREVMLSDEPLLEEMAQALKQNGYRFSVAVECIVRSRQFREIRGKSFTQAAQ